MQEASQHSEAPIRRLSVTFYSGRNQTTPLSDSGEATWEQVCTMLGHHDERDRKDGRMFSPVRLKPGASRANGSVEALSMAVIDMDHCSDYEDRMSSLDGFEFIAYTTHSHTSGDPCFRIVMPFASDVPASRWPAVWKALNDMVGGAADRGCKHPSAAYYLPSHPPGRVPQVIRGHGRWLRPDELRPEPGTRAPQLVTRATGDADADTLFVEALKRMDSGRHETARWFTWELRLRNFPESVGLSYCERFVEAADASSKRHGTGVFKAKEYLDLLHGAYRRELTRDFPLTDTGNAERLIETHGQDLRYNIDSGKWLVWRGTHWHSSPTGGEAMQLSINLARRLHLRGVQELQEAQECRERQARTDAEKAAQRKIGFALSSESISRLKATLEIAQKLPSARPVRLADLNSDIWSLNCANGTVDLRTGELRPHSRDDLNTVCLATPYDPSAECPAFQAFLTDVFEGDGDLIRFVQKAIGYSLTGDVSEQCFFVLHGGGSNGKGTLLDTVTDLLGGYFRKTPTATLMEGDTDRASNELARLCTARLVTAEETTAGKRLAESLVKSMTGSDVLTARFLYRESFEYKPSFKLWLACNHLPRIDGQDHAIWRRIHVVPFRVRYSFPTDPDRRPSDHDRDNSLKTKLLAELPGVLAWAVQGCLRWQSEGLGRCAAVTNTTQDYRDTQDILGDFLRECCVVDASERVMAKDLYTCYRQWGGERGEKPIPQRTFTIRLKERGRFSLVKREGLNCWQGVGLLVDVPPPTEAPIGVLGVHGAQDSYCSYSSDDISSTYITIRNQDTIDTLDTVDSDEQPEEDEHETSWL